MDTSCHPAVIIESEVDSALDSTTVFTRLSGPTGVADATKDKELVVSTPAQIRLNNLFNLMFSLLLIRL
ncbi:hypothetical protein D3C76_1536160 [compost metagenome]